MNPLSIKVSDLNLSARTKTWLRIDNIQTVGDIAKLSERNLYRIPNVGRVSVQEIKNAIEPLGVTLKDNEPVSLERQMEIALIQARAAKERYEQAAAQVSYIAKQMAETPLVAEDL